MKRHALLAIFPAVLVALTAQGAVFEYTASLSGALEAPASPGTGTADVFFNDSAQTLRVIVSFSGLLGTTTASHIHAPTSAPFTGNAGVATTVPTFPLFPLGVTSGTYDQTLDFTLASTYNPAFVTANGGTVSGAETAHVNALNLRESYLNIHTSAFPGGEIRGFLVSVPESTSTASLLGLATLLLFAAAPSSLRQRPSYQRIC